MHASLSPHVPQWSLLQAAHHGPQERCRCPKPPARHQLPQLGCLHVAVGRGLVTCFRQLPAAGCCWSCAQHGPSRQRSTKDTTEAAARAARTPPTFCACCSRGTMAAHSPTSSSVSPPSPPPAPSVPSAAHASSSTCQKQGWVRGGGGGGVSWGGVCGEVGWGGVGGQARLACPSRGCRHQQLAAALAVRAAHAFNTSSPSWEYHLGMLGVPPRNAT